MAPDAIIDTLTIEGYGQQQIISQFNLQRDSLELWINSRRAAPDTMKISVNYFKTDSTGVLARTSEQIRLGMPNEKRTYSKRTRRTLTKEDTTCVYTLTADPKTIEQNGYVLEFRYPIINEKFDSLEFSYITPRQTRETGEFSVERDSLNLRRYVLRPKDKLQKGFEYYMKVPYRAFRDINNFYSDSTEVKFTLPDDEALSTLLAEVKGVDRKLIIDLLSEKRDKVLRSFIIDSDATLTFPYLSAGKYCIRITEDSNRNSIVDTGSVLGHKQPERVKFYEIGGEKFIDLPKGVELLQTIDTSEMFKD